MAKKNRRQIAVFGGSGGFAAVSSQFQNKHLKSNCRTKAHCCNFLKKNKLGSNNSEMYNSVRNGKKNRRQMAVFGGSGGFAAVSSQFLNKHHKSNCHTKAHCCYSFFG